MLSEVCIREAIERNDTYILSEKSLSNLNNEIKHVLAIVQYLNNNNLTERSLLEDIRANAVGAPENSVYNENLLSNKISSLRSRIQRLEYLDATKQVKKAEEKNNNLNQTIEELKSLYEKAKKRSNEIRKFLKELNDNEYNNVGPYLYKIYCKLSRDVNISGFDLNGGRGNGVRMLQDCESNPIQNMLSDGQLSVLMLSYFFGNVFRLKDSDPFKVHFLDDVTGTMDDINMLAFLDLIKYQLSSQDSAIDQLFFTTCDSRIQDIFRYKMSQCGIDYKEIGIKEFDD